KAAAVGADGAVLDLEDGVGLPAKETARQAALRFFEAPLAAPVGFVWAVRFNHVATEDGLKDLLAFRAAAHRPSVVMLRKTESVTEVEIAAHHLKTGAGGAPQMIALIEIGREAGGLINVVRCCGISVGVAAASALLAWRLAVLTGSGHNTLHAGPPQLLSASRDVIVLLVAFAAIGAATSFARRAATAEEPTPQ